MAEPRYEAVWPLGKSVYETVPLAPPIEDLNGKTVCQVWDELFRGDEMLAIIREELTKRYPAVKFLGHTLFGNTTGPNQREVVAALPGLLRQHGCDAVISGVGA